MTLKNGFGKCSSFVLLANGSKRGLFVFPPKKPYCNIVLQYDVKRSIDWFQENSRAWSFSTRAFAELIKSHARLYLFDKPIKSLYFRSFVVSVLFARFHFKVIRKSLKQSRRFKLSFNHRKDKRLSARDINFSISLQRQTSLTAGVR